MKGEFEIAITNLDKVSENSFWHSISRSCIEYSREKIEEIQAAAKIRDLRRSARKARNEGRERMNSNSWRR